jgi:ketosteroid isomerase-like protein
VLTEQKNQEIVQELYAAFARGDVPALLELVSDDVDWCIAGTSDVPYAGARRGREGVVAFLESLAASVAFDHFEPRGFVAQGDIVVVTGLEQGRALATGKSFENEWAMVFRLTDGKVAGLKSYEDTAAVAAAFRR